jgi:hypothetical protein
MLAQYTLPARLTQSEPHIKSTYKKLDIYYNYITRVLLLIQLITHTCKKIIYATKTKASFPITYRYVALWVFSFPPGKSWDNILMKP